MTDDELRAPDPVAVADDDALELYEHAPCGYLSTGDDGTITRINATLCGWIGHPSGDLVGQRRFVELLAPGARIYFETHLAPSLRLQGTVREIATEIVRADGSRLHVILNGAVSRPEIGGFRFALFDATERRSYEVELRAARDRAEASEARARALAETLQASFLPPGEMEIDGLEVAGAYRPAGDGGEVGGDFYDLFETGRGTWGIVLGDVMGKGASAATVTALARHTVRSESLRSPYPTAALVALHEAIERDHPDRFCTAVLLHVGRHLGGWRLSIAVAGHHLPMLLRDGEVERVGTTGTILGIVDDVDLVDERVALRHGDVLVLFTDGVTEARRNDVFLGDDAVRDVLLASVHLPAQTIADAIVRRAVDFQLGTPRDDIAVVVLRVP